MDCKHTKKLFSAYLDEKLNPRERKGIEDHLASCAGCRKQWQLYQKSWEMLSRWENIEPDADFIPRFWAKAAGQTSAPQLAREKNLWEWPRLVFKGRLAHLFATACLFFIIGIVALNIRLNRQTTMFLSGLSADTLAMAEDYELLRDYELITDIDFFEELRFEENGSS